MFREIFENKYIQKFFLNVPEDSRFRTIESLLIIAINYIRNTCYSDGTIGYIESLAGCI